MAKNIDEVEKKVAVSMIVFITVLGIAGSYYFANSDVSAILCTIFGFFSIKYIVDDKFAEKANEYF